ncbi:hypothetical protein FHS27_002429 [Rhodopirellula rubra]|uniref:Uncharacterized protein n=1 Tax=Aporhodopirellula rubra TaxID=980271 RepID=A0A7W5H4P4_9BACT|nr:hypothetical protein [Aporhodopirellula rubra]
MGEGKLVTFREETLAAASTIVEWARLKRTGSGIERVRCFRPHIILLWFDEESWRDA